MLFNSYEFIFVFLPVVLVVFFFLARISRRLALAWLVASSLAFYAWWRPVNVPIIGASLLFNFCVAYGLSKSSWVHSRASGRTALLAIGIVFNLCFLGYFKYVNFAREALNDIAGTDFVLTFVILPLGISFITFQKIAFLVDVHAGRVKQFSFREFVLFVLFFPQLIAGPIVHFREMMPQFKGNSLRLDFERLSAGLTLFVFGLFKKVVLADGMSAYVTPVYEYAADGGVVTLFQGWIAAVGFTLQMYFDFSGYSDMAAGLAFCFGVRLPLNFDSPLKARNIIDFWARWHITLTRFLTAYVFNPLALRSTRKRLSKGLPVVGLKNTSMAAFVQVLALPTLLTMTLSGLWHGAGYLFLLWGVLHGVYLVINHGWRILWPQGAAKGVSERRIPRILGVAVTFFSVAIAMVLFRSSSVSAAIEIYQGMFAFNGIGLPSRLFELMPNIQIISELSVTAPISSLTEFVIGHAWMLALLGLALFIPNTAEIMHAYAPFLEEKILYGRNWLRYATWRPTLTWVVFVGALAATAIMRMAGRSEFLYWQF